MQARDVQERRKRAHARALLADPPRTRVLQRQFGRRQAFGPDFVLEPVHAHAVRERGLGGGEAEGHDEGGERARAEGRRAGAREGEGEVAVGRGGEPFEAGEKVGDAQVRWDSGGGDGDGFGLGNVGAAGTLSEG